MKGLKISHLCTLLLLGISCTPSTTQVGGDDLHPQNFVYFGLERSRISEANFLETSSMVGAQLKYTWRELEPDRDQYELGMILQDLAFLEAHGKRLFIQLQDVSFEEWIW